jgi:hypothetical protein
LGKLSLLNNSKVKNLENPPGNTALNLHKSSATVQTHLDPNWCS